MLRIVVDTNLWIRALLGGPITFPILEAWQARRFTVVVSQPQIDELDDVWQRPRLRRRIDVGDAERLRSGNPELQGCGPPTAHVKHVRRRRRLIAGDDAPP